MATDNARTANPLPEMGLTRETCRDFLILYFLIEVYSKCISNFTLTTTINQPWTKITRERVDRWG